MTGPQAGWIHLRYHTDFLRNLSVGKAARAEPENYAAVKYTWSFRRNQDSLPQKERRDLEIAIGAYEYHRQFSMLFRDSVDRHIRRALKKCSAAYQQTIHPPSTSERDTRNANAKAKGRKRAREGSTGGRVNRVSPRQR